MEDTIKKSGVRKNISINVGREVYDAVDEKVKRILEEAEERAEANDRNTVMARDI